MDSKQNKTLKHQQSQIIEDVENDSDQDSNINDRDVDSIKQGYEGGYREDGGDGQDDYDYDSQEDEGNQYYDSQEGEEDEVVDGHSPINLPEGTFMELEEEYEEEEKIYSICAEGKKTKIHGVELYGFFIWNLSSLLFLGFLIWCYVPTSMLNSWGIYYIPNKYYAVAFPTWFFMTLFMVIMLYVAIGMIHCHDRDSYKTMQDYASILTKPKDYQDNQGYTNNINVINTGEISNSTAVNDSPTNQVNTAQTTASIANNKVRQQLINNSPGKMMNIMKKHPSMNSQGGLRNRKIQSSSSNLGRLRDTRNPYGRRENDELNINYFAKIPDIVELPITVVNNVLYSKAQWKQQE